MCKQPRKSSQPSFSSLCMLSLCSCCQSERVLLRPLVSANVFAAVVSETNKSYFQSFFFWLLAGCLGSALFIFNSFSQSLRCVSILILHSSLTHQFTSTQANGGQIHSASHRRDRFRSHSGHRSAGPNDGPTEDTAGHCISAGCRRNRCACVLWRRLFARGACLSLLVCSFRVHEG